MAQQVTVTARGLFLSQNELGAVPDGALGQADNCVISKDGIVETKRGLSAVAAKAIERIFPFKGYLVGWAASVLSRSSDYGATWTDYSGNYAAPAMPVHAAEMNGNLYFTTATGPQRLDSFTGTPEPAGIPGATDVQAQIGAAGTAVPPGNQVAYRIAWGKRDANGNLLLGAPSGRSVTVNPAPYVIAIGNLVRVTNVVTATLSAGVTNVFRVGESVTLSPGEANFAAGVKVLTAVTSTTFSYAETAADATSTAAQTFTGPARDVSVVASIPQGLPVGAFYQAYRSPNSGLETQIPDDNLGLVYESAAPSVAALTQLARLTGVVTATAAVAHGFSVAQIVRVSPGGGSGGGLAAVGDSAASTSPDAITWTSRTIPAGTYRAVAWNGTVFAAVGDNVCATSPDGITWTTRTIPAGIYRGIAWNGSLFAAVGTNEVVATSPDGITWTARGPLGAGSILNAIAWNGSVFAAVGTGAPYTSPDGITWTRRGIGGGFWTGVSWNGSVFVAVSSIPNAATSPDGATWTLRTIPAGSYSLYAVAWNGAVFAAVGTATITSPDGVTWTARTMPAGTYNAVGTLGSTLVAVGTTTVCASSADGITWTSQTITAGTYRGIANSATLNFAPGEFSIASVPTSTTFTYAQAGADGTLVQAQTATPLTAQFTDSIPSGFIGAALYTNPNEGTIQAAANRLALCQDIATFRGFTFAGNVTYPSRASVYLLAVGGTSGIAAGDTITIDGLVYTAHATVESIGSRTFIAYTSGTPSQNIANTVASLLRIINRTQTNSISAVYLSGPNDVPGLFYLEEHDTTSTMTVAFSRPTVWSIQSLKAPENRASELRWSAANQPDAWPLLNTSPVGSLDKPIKRILATRDMLLVVKDDGLWRVTGYNGVWDIVPLDPTMGTPAPESLVAFENAVFGILDSGAVRITESGVESIVAPIYSALEPLLATAALATTAAEAFGIAYHSAHKYILWLPGAAGDTKAKQAFAYDSWTQAWVRWTPPTGIAGWNHGIVNPADDRLYLADGTNVYREKKAMDDTDLQDATDVNAPLTVTAIPVTVKYLPKFGGNPGQLHHFQEVALIFRRIKFTSMSVSFSTNVSPSEETITLSGADYGVNAAIGTQTTIRVLVPLEKARASQLNIKISHAEAGSPFQLEGISVVYRPGSTRVGR